MRAIFVVPVVSGEMQLPELTEWLPDGSARDGSGFSALGQIPQAGTAMCLVDTSTAIVEAMAVDPNYLFVEYA